MKKDPIRLSKLMSERGLSSRREADLYIKEGLVLVNCQIISDLGTKVEPDVSIELLPAAYKKQKNKKTILLNKPLGYVSMLSKEKYPTAASLIDCKTFFQKKVGVAGRLDVDSKGLLIFSQDGVLIKKLIGPDSQMEKEYIVRVEGNIIERSIKLLRFGLFLDEKPLKSAQVKLLKSGLLQFVLTEGKKRQIRRMCELVGLRVVSLKRVRIGRVRLGNLPEGAWRFLNSEESF